MHAALIFAYIERIFSQEDRKAAVQSSISTLEDFLPRLRDVGFKDMVVDESYEIPRDLIKGIVDPEPVSTDGTTLTPARLLREFQDESSTWISNSNILSSVPVPRRAMMMDDATTPFLPPQRPIIWSRSCAWPPARRSRASRRRTSPS
jgi:hypothetical protein